MGHDSQFRSLGRLLYTQNPFYLISCVLILYGLLVTAQANSDLFTRSVFLTASIAAYTLLMAVTSVGVIRLAKVWEDARSILLVVVISHVAMSTAMDELCNLDWKRAGGLLAAAGVFAVAVTELVLRCCRIRLPSWYRAAFYGLLVVFFAMPVLMGHAVAEHNKTLTSWGAPLFSTCIAAALLLLTPAVRQRESFVRDNGTPWSWPLFPLSAFAILVVLAVIRSHAIWMSFGFIGAPARFEPFLLLPIVLAILILVVESDWRVDVAAAEEASGDEPQHIVTFAAIAVAPMMLMCGLTRGGMTFLPIREELVSYGGSATTVSLLAVLLFYGYAWMRGVPCAAYAVVVTLFGISVWGELPTSAVGLQHWMVAALATAICLCLCLRNVLSDERWFVFSVAACKTIVMAGHASGDSLSGWATASGFGIVAALMIGACFDSTIAVLLRQIAAAVLIVGAAMVLAWHVIAEPGMTAVALLLTTAIGALVYMRLVRRWWWLWVAGIHAATALSILGFDSYQAGTLTTRNLPIQSGLLCFVIGVTITSLKTGAYQRLRGTTDPRAVLSKYRRGF